jgi:hypothetical protein
MKTEIINLRYILTEDFTIIWLDIPSFPGIYTTYIIVHYVCTEKSVIWWVSIIDENFVP